MTNKNQIPDKNNLVTKSNMLIEARYKFSLEASKVAECIISQIEPQDEDFKAYCLSAKTFSDLIGSTTQNAYARLKAVCEEVVREIVKIKKPDGSFLVAAFFSSAEYIKDQGRVEFSFDPKLKPFMLMLKGCFTSYRLSNVLCLKSVYSIRIYQLLKQYEKIKERSFEINELKTLLGIENIASYERYDNFKRKVLLPAQKELLAKCDIGFLFKEIKTGRKITHLEFTVVRNANVADEIKEDKKISQRRELVKFAKQNDARVEKIKKEEHKAKVNKNIKFMTFIKEQMTDHELSSIYEAGKGDLAYIEGRYKSIKSQKHVDNLVGYLIWACQASNAQFRESKIKLKTDKFRCVPQREYDFDAIQASIDARYDFDAIQASIDARMDC